MKFLFYLPVVTPWWFDSIIEPLIRRVAESAEVHIVAPIPWRGTGIGSRELMACADLPQLRWHIIDDASHPTMRTVPDERAAIVDFVNSIAPDYVLCRSADCETARGFSGVVRYVMEASASPLDVPYWIVLQEQPFDHGLMPDLAPAELAELDRLIAPAWSSLRRLTQASRQMRKSFRAWAGLPADRPVLALPLEYEHPENFFTMHRMGATPNHRLIAELAETIDDSFFLAVTNHPLNVRHIDNSALEAEIASHGSRMRLLPVKTPEEQSSTMLLARDAQGILAGDSKIYSMAGFFGTPLLRRSRFKTGAWLNAYTDLESFLPAVARGEAASADPDAARSWFAFHTANNLFDPKDPDWSAEDLAARIDKPVDSARWEAGFARYRAAVPEHFQ